MSTLNTLPYAALQGRDVVTAKFMLSDGPDRDTFARLRVSQPVTLYEGSTIYDSNPVFFDNDTRGSATITGPTNAAMTLTVTGSTTNDYAARQSHFYAHYQPGKSFLAMFSFAFGPATAGITKRVGLYDVDNTNLNNPLNGMLLEQTASGLTWYVYKGDGTSQSAAQAAWNVDPLNGLGASGYTLTPLAAEQNLLAFVDLEWLGVGRVRVGFFINGVPVVCNAFNNTQFSVPYVNNPLLPIRYEVRRTSGSATGTMKTICCTILSEGGFDPIGVVHSIQSGQVSVSQASVLSLVAIRLTSTCPRAILSPVSTEIASTIGGNATAYYSTYLWRPSSAAVVIPGAFAPVSNLVGGSGSFAEYNFDAGVYTAMNNDFIANPSTTQVIKMDEGSVSSVAKNNFQFIQRSLDIAQSSVDRTNRDILVVTVNNTTPNSRFFWALLTWREI